LIVVYAVSIRKSYGLLDGKGSLVYLIDYYPKAGHTEMVCPAPMRWDTKIVLFYALVKAQTPVGSALPLPEVTRPFAP
jgi:hypothetical protein